MKTKKLNKTSLFREISKYDDVEYNMINIDEKQLTRFIIDCKWNKLKVIEPTKEPDMAVGNLTIKELTNIIKTVVIENTLSKQDVIQIFDEKIKPIKNEISLIKQQMVTKEYLDQRLKPIEEDIKMLKSFHTREIQEYHKNNK